jgi:hypothetical protein
LHPCLTQAQIPCTLIGRSHQQPDVQRRGPPENGHHPHWRRAVVWGEAAQQYSVQSDCFQATLSVLCLFVFSDVELLLSRICTSAAPHTLASTLPGWLIGPPDCLPACLPAWLTYPSCLPYVLYRHTLKAVGSADEAVWLILHPCSLSVQSPFEHCRFFFCCMAVGSASLGCGLSTVSAALSDNVIIAEFDPFFQCMYAGFDATQTPDGSLRGYGGHCMVHSGALRAHHGWMVWVELPLAQGPTPWTIVCDVHLCAFDWACMALLQSPDTRGYTACSCSQVDLATPSASLMLAVQSCWPICLCRN